MPQIILSEIVPIKLSPKSLNESISQREGRMIFPTLLQRANSKNANTRIYPRSVLEREISNYVAGPIAEKRAYGELDHSEETVVNFKNSCIHINEVWWDGDEIWGSVEVLDTPAGKIVQEVLKKGFSAGISSRGIGSVTEIDEDTVEVDDDFTLICWDVVTNPSTHGSFVGVKKLNEGVKVPEGLDKIDQVISDILCMNLGFCECKLK